MKNIPRHSLIYLLLATSLALFPLLDQLSHFWWGLLTIVLIIRWMLHLGRWSFPNIYFRIAIVATGFALVFFDSGRQLSLESATSLLAAATMAKLLESREKRDVYILMFLSFFNLAVFFLYKQALLNAAYALTTVALILLVLAKIQIDNYQLGNKLIKVQAKMVLSSLLMSLPVMLFVFVLFPRLDPLWSFNLQSGKAKTGLSSSMKVGDIADLSQSDELVFTAKFADKQSPENRDLYWRMLVLDYYQEGEWKEEYRPETLSVTANYSRDWREQNKKDIYTIIMEPSHKSWLPILADSIPMDYKFPFTDQANLLAKTPVYSRLRYQLLHLAKDNKNKLRIQADNLTIDHQANILTLSPRQKYIYTQIEEDRNPKTQNLALSWRKQGLTDRQIVEQVARMINSGGYIYTLKPGRASGDEIDHLLFTSKRGFCAHYSSAATYLLRTANIPARIVAGYQGGSKDDVSDFITVRQYDAHAWIEYWIDGVGWLRFDPTALIAPDRVEQGLEQAVAFEDTFLQGQAFSVHAGSGFLRNISQVFVRINYKWQDWVLSYDKDKQEKSLFDFFGKDFKVQSFYWLGVGFAIAIFLMSFLLLWRPNSKKQTKIEKQLSLLSKSLIQYQLNWAAGVTINDYLAALADALKNPESQYNKLRPSDDQQKKQQVFVLVQELQQGFTRLYYQNSVSPERKKKLELMIVKQIKLLKSKLR